MTSKIEEFYKNTNILITGGMGFLGKILIQKLLRECNGINGIYLIVREKYGKDIHTRMDEIFKDIVFDKLRKHSECFMEKIYLVEGDCSKLDLGLSKDDKEMLARKINIVFHMAASLNMDSNLRDAVEINVRGTRETIKLCKEMEKLKSVIYVSTAYSNCDNSTIEERFYTPKLSGETLIKLTEELDDKTLRKITPVLLDDMPNTYVYTKCASEDLISNKANGLPLAIFRPSIVQPAYQDPICGWTDNFYGPTGIAIAILHGLIRFAYCKKNKHVDIIPVDYCANALISSAWDLQNRITEITQGKYPIYNYTAGLKLSLTWSEYSDRIKKISEENPLSKALWPVHCFYIQNLYMYYLTVTLFHYLPAFIMDIGFFISRKKTKMIRLYNKLHKIIFILVHFSMQEFDFQSDNVYCMWDNLNETDKKKFPFDLKTLNWNTYTRNVYYGIKYYLVKDNKKDMKKDIRRYKVLQILEKTLISAAVLGIVTFPLFKIYV